MRFCLNEGIKNIHCNFLLPFGRAKRDVNLVSFFKILKGLENVVKFNNDFSDEITISIPIELVMTNYLFNLSGRGNLNEIEKLDSKQYVCNILVHENLCKAGWGDSKLIRIKNTSIIDAFKLSKNSNNNYRTKFCKQCKLADICEKSSYYLDKCLIQLFIEKMKSLLSHEDKSSARETARNFVYDLCRNESKYSCIELIVTSKCNGKCNFCQAMGSHDDKCCYFNIKDLKEFIGEKRVHVTISGGEPLIKQKEVISIIKLIKNNKNSIITLLTNLSLISDDFIDEIKKNFGYYDVIQVSIYSHDPVKHKIMSSQVQICV